VSADLDLVMNQYVCLHPGARDARRRWPIENFAYIGNKLLETGHKIVLTGSVQETDILNALEAKIHAPVINIVRQIGDVPLGILAATIENSRLLISNDTGVSHIAAGLRHPSVIIFSPYSDVNRWAPLNSALHRVILAEKATDPEYVLYCILDQLQKSGVSQSSLLLDEI
jgi:ADP-heptose:LPS heptosyltransferase